MQYVALFLILAILYIGVARLNNIFNVTVNIPYPSIEILRKDTNFAYKLFHIYAGNISELTATSQYSFQSFYLKEYKDLSNILEQISKVEMHHLKILANLILELGLTPYYVTYGCGNKPITWNSDFVDYTTDYRDMLLSNINSEINAIRDYNKLINETTDSNIRKILKRIIMDEERHIEIFRELLRQYDTYEN